MTVQSPNAKRLLRSALTLTLTGLAAPAFAHVGDHSGFSLAALASHLFEPDHVAFAVIGAGAAWLAFKAGRRAEARARQRAESGQKQERSHDPR